MKAIRDKAREMMKGYCRVCPVCDGRVCAGEVPGMGGLGTAASFKDNVAALAEVKAERRAKPDAGDMSEGGRPLPLAARPRPSSLATHQ
jgi:hypothetical protein